MKYLPKLWAAMSCVLLVVIFAATSCKQASEKQGEKMMENALEQASDEETDVDLDDNKVTIETDSMKTVIETGAKVWPETIPSEVPVFTWGKVIHTTTSEIGETKAWGVHFEIVPMDALDRYDTELKKTGFKTTKFSMGKGGSVTGEKGKLLVTATVGEGKGHVSIQLQP